MAKVGVAEGALRELTNELQLSVSEEVRNKISALETDLVDENEKFASLIARVEKHREMQQERERKIYLQHRRTMGSIDIVLRCPQNVNGIAADPQPDWSFDNLLSELDSIEKRLTPSSDIRAASFTKTQPRKLHTSKENYGSARGFVMHLSDHEIDYTDSDSEEEVDSLSIIQGRRFACDELYMSADSEDESPLEVQYHLMDKVGLAEGALRELTNELQLSVSEEVRNKISALETDLVDENDKFASLIARVEKHREMQQERERKIDLQYRRTIAEALDNHLTALQRDHEHMSQLEERKIRDDAARQESKRREKEEKLRREKEEKLRQEKARADEEIRLKFERDKAAAVKIAETEKKAAEEAEAKHVATETLRDAARNVKKEIQPSARNLVRASENALELEKRRRQKYDEISANYEALKVSSNQDYSKHGQNINRRIKTISATVENIRKRADELFMLINSQGCPQSFNMLLFAEKVVSNCTKQESPSAIFAVSRVIVLVTSKIPEAMDFVIAEINKVCIYTVPKHISYSEAAFPTKNAYFKAIGYKEEEGKIESTDKYLEKLSLYMKLYGALVQTEVGIQNIHGLREGWAWLARFLNALPANLYTAVALHSFLEMAGFTLYRRYKNQFEKLLNIIARDFIKALKEGGSESWNTKLEKTTVSILNYIDSKQFKKEPEGLQLRGHLESNDFY